MEGGGRVREDKLERYNLIIKSLEQSGSKLIMECLNWEKVENFDYFSLIESPRVADII